MQDGVPQGTVFNFTMNSADSKIYPGIARDAGHVRHARSRTIPPSSIVTTSHPAPYTRRVAVYVPKQYVPGTAAPFIVGADGPDQLLFTALDNLIAQKRVPVMIAISIGNGSGDAQGSQRGLEYDTMSGRYAEFVETEVLPLVEKQCNVKLTKDPDGRATMGCSSGGRCGDEHGVVSPRPLPPRAQLLGHVREPAVAAQSRDAAAARGNFTERLIPNSPAKPIRIWMHVGDRDLSIRTSCATTCTTGWSPTRTWPRCWRPRATTTSSCSRATAGHCDRAVKQQTLPDALEYVWKDYPVGQKLAK